MAAIAQAAMRAASRWVLSHDDRNLPKKGALELLFSPSIHRWENSKV
jgi:hypothetical protein